METLYRKYRPLDFDTVVGQDNIVKTLRNQIIKGSIAHAYLFSGTRGTGKTTVARIFARAINCPNELNGNPCNECQTCKNEISGNSINIVEVDAASKGGVEGIRNIIEKLEYPPMNGEKYKVFIIDEAHALTSDASQAFLKSLEEPPEYVVFILATTDPNKLPETILSRCQKYNFKRINIDTIVGYLKKISENEKIDIDDEALAFIAEKSDGSMRESISKLDMIRAYAFNEKLSKEKVLDILGIVDDEDFAKVVKAINTLDVIDAFNVLNDCLEKGKDINQFTNGLIWHLRNLLIVKDINEPIETLNITKTSFEKLKKESELVSKDVLIYFIEELSKTLNLMKFDENRRVLLETTFIRLANPETNFMESAVMARLSNIERIQSEGTYIRKIDTNDNNKYIDDVKNEDEKTNKSEKKKIDEIKLSPASYEEIKKITENWATIAASVSRMFRSIMVNSKPIPGNEKEPGFVEVQVEEKEYDFLSLFDNIKELEEMLSNKVMAVIGKKVIFKIIKQSESKYDKKVTWKIDDALDKINMKIEEENDK